ncbi:RNA 2',3'-cyclic phosphodiesterase [Candidatus Woesearchaeota archaeon]|nr:RNA 2',3'-cyclic phosphodiesterase [Candidatus Woesearchaeota archaeon]
MRLFIALDLKELEDYFKKIQKQIPAEPIAQIKPVSSFHLTLKFLGEINNPDEIKKSLEKIKMQGLKLKLSPKLGVFPSESYIKVVWVGLEENEDLIQLQKDIQKAVPHIRDDFKFLPHLTLARVKFIRNKEAFVKKIRSIKVDPKTVEIKKFKLIKSELTRKGAKYTDLTSFPQSL